MIGKSFDTFGPMGPALVTADEIPDPHCLELSLTLNGQEMQRTNTGNMIFSIPFVIAYLSAVMTLEPGDVISTGTPAKTELAAESAALHEAGRLGQDCGGEDWSAGQPGGGRGLKARARSDQPILQPSTVLQQRDHVRHSVAAMYPSPPSRSLK